jgi:hypothetical protein
MVIGMVSFQFSAGRYPLFPAIFVEETVLFLLHVFGNLVED